MKCIFNLQNTRHSPFEYPNNDNNEYILNEIKLKRLPSPRFGHAATKYIFYFNTLNFYSSNVILDILEDFLCMAVN